jgi:hypothetical protein
MMLTAAAGVVLAGCQGSAVVTPEVIAISKPSITLDPNDRVWNDVSTHVSPMLLQDLVDPRLMEPSTKEVRVKAITDGTEVAFRVEWADDSQNDVPGPKHFLDGCAIQLPAAIDPNVPAPQMGEAGKRVEITFWRADWQAIVDGRADDITSIYPHASVDHYPADAKPLEKDPNLKREAELRYAPARALGNRRSGPREQPVEDMIAEGPGTLTPVEQNFSKGKGVRTGDGWAVVISRPIPVGFGPATPTQIAFAVWQGSQGEIGGRKMRTGWVNFLMK